MASCPRFSFQAVLTAGLLLLFPLAAYPESNTSAPALTPQQAARLQRALAPLHERYDPAEQMLKEPFSSPGYHTALKGGFVHSTRSSLNYAVALLDTGDETLRARAEAILSRVVALQDQDPSSKTYGIWSWFLEEPLDKMSPPDWNWADFCGTALLQVVQNHRDRLSPALRERIDASIRHAADSIRRRNVGPGYTNIAIMGTYVTLIASELYDLPDLHDYAMARWRRFYDYTFSTGGFTEYNSPTYTVVALKEVARLLQHAKEPEALRLGRELYQLLWKDIATHFHFPTRQWAGPHSRCYHTLLGSEVLELIQRGCDGRVSFGVDKPSLDEINLRTPCPTEFERFFLQFQGPREFRQTFVKGERPVIGTTLLEQDFALGTVNRGDLWNQRRPLLVYFGSQENPAYLRLRFLHNDYDFAAAQFFSVQKGAAVLAGINFALDGGDTHPSLDRIKDAVIEARDLRLRFEFGGAAAKERFRVPSRATDPVAARCGALQFNLAVPFAAWGDAAPFWQEGSDKETSFIDVVLYSGPSRKFDLKSLGQAGAVVLLAINQSLPVVSTNQNSANLEVTAGGLKLLLPLRPNRGSETQKISAASLVE